MTSRTKILWFNNGVIKHALKSMLKGSARSAQMQSSFQKPQTLEVWGERFFSWVVWASPQTEYVILFWSDCFCLKLILCL